jgi:hypothetical protein
VVTTAIWAVAQRGSDPIGSQHNDEHDILSTTFQQEESMRKTYAAPAILTCGDAVHATKAASPGVEISASTGPEQAVGSVGFHL